MREKLLLTAIVCLTLTGCSKDAETDNTSRKEELVPVTISTRAGAYPDDTTFGFVVYRSPEATEPESSLSGQVGTYRYTNNPANTPYNNADHLIPCDMNIYGRKVKSGHDENPLISYQYYNPYAAIRVVKGTNYVYMYTPAIPAETYTQLNSMGIEYERDIELQISSKPFVINADGYAGSCEVEFDNDVTMVTMMSRMNFNFIQGGTEKIKVTDVEADNLGGCAICHPKTRECVVLNSWVPELNRKAIAVTDENNATKGQVSYKSTSAINVFPADYGGGVAPNLLVRFKLEIDGSFANVSLPLPLVVLANKIYNININVTSQMLTFSYSYSVWKPNELSDDVGDYDGSQIPLGTFTLTDWVNGNEGGGDQEDNIL